MTAVVCVLLTAVGCYFSFALGHQWWLAWLAPIPVLWLAFGPTKTWKSFLAAWAGFALGFLGFLRPYGSLFPAPSLICLIGGPGLLFAMAAMAARRINRGLGAVPAMLAFGALWAGLDLLASRIPAFGSALSPAGAEVSAPALIQVASLVGHLGVTFLLGCVSAGIAIALRERKSAPALVATAMFFANASYGFWHMAAPPRDSMRVALIDSDTATGPHGQGDEKATLAVTDAYVAQIERLETRHIQLIVLPENISHVDRAWRSTVEARLAAAANATGATIVAGFGSYYNEAGRNVAWAFTPGNSTPETYEKRRLIPGAETSVFKPGPGPLVLPGGIGIEICKDMDFPRMIRRDEVAGRPKLLAVPAWDFGADAWSHARIAILRSVENGVPMARSARRGLLTLNDRYGRIVAQVHTSSGFTTQVGDLPLDGRGGGTFYDRIGNAFGWLCLIAGSGLFAAAPLSSWARQAE